jgi:class 3 adenylate cyclase
MQNNLPPLSPSHIKFAKQVAECNFLQKMTSVFARRHAELRRESGSYWKALTETHLPQQKKFYGILKGQLDTLKDFQQIGEDEAVEPSEEISKIERLLGKFETHVINALVKGHDLGEKQSKESLLERHARKAIKDKAQPACRKIAFEAHKMHQAARQKLEHIAKSELVFETKPVRKKVTIVSIDLARYGHHSKIISDMQSTNGVFELNEQIQQMITGAIHKTLVPAQVGFLIQDTGDGALVVLDGESAGKNGELCSLILDFAEAFFRSVRSANQNRNEETKLHFRMGASTGLIELAERKVTEQTVVGFKMAGLAIAKAVRLQAAARTGELLVCETTLKSLPDEHPYELNQREEVMGKTHEVFPIPGRRCKLMEPAPPEADKKKTLKPKRRKRKN